MSPGIDLHQHLWPEPLLDRLRARMHPPYVRGWQLFTATEPPYDIRPEHHDVAARTAMDVAEEVGLACVSLSSPLGIESLPPWESGPLLGAWHQGAAALPAHYRAWASVHDTEPDLPELHRLLGGGFVGVQVPATRLLRPADWLAAGEILEAAQQHGRPVLVHPGPAPSSEGEPGWWAPVVGYVAQLQSAWWAWHALDGRAHFPRLRLVFAAGAGLAPLQHERLTARGGSTRPIDPDVFVDTSSYGPQGLDALVRVLGIDTVVLGTDAPYASADVDSLGVAAARRIRVDNPRRALGLAAGAQEAVA